MKNPCLVFVDWQQGFADLEYWGGGRNNPLAEQNAVQLLRHWRHQQWPVVHIRHDSTDPNSKLHPNQPGNALEAFANPLAGEPLYAKNVNSAFIGTDLETDLRAQNISKLVFCGISTDHCVNTSVRMAANLGFEVRVAADACYTFDRTDALGRQLDAQTIHDVHLASLHGEFAQIKTTEQIIIQTW
ncbi:MAG: cysteine hydrolase [Robiginitomaculum sp.]|nr:cysteine hydrolase [Robiginitomaculum sp.]